MASKWITQDAVLGQVDLTLVDTAGPGPFALVGSNAGRMGRYNVPSQFIEATDPVLGGGLFAFAQVATITAQTVSSVALNPALASQSVTSITISGNTATITTGANHLFTAGQTVVTLSGFTPAGYNGTFVILTTPTGTTATFQISTGTPGGSSTVQGTYVTPTTYALITTGSAHGLGLGSTVQLTGFTPAAWNNGYVVYNVPSTTTLVVNLATVFSNIPPYVNASALVTNQDSANVNVNTNIATTNPTVTGTYVPGIGIGQVVQFSHVIDANSNLVLQVAPWAGTVNTGFSLAVAISYPQSGNWAWFQIAGAAIVYAYGTPVAGNSAYFAATGGAVQPVAVASKQVVGAQFATAPGVTLGVGTGNTVLAFNQAVLYADQLIAQGAVT